MFIERLWRSVKCEEACLGARDSVPDVKADLGRSFEFCDSTRPHSSFGRTTPEQFHDKLLPAPIAAYSTTRRFQISDLATLYRRTRPHLACASQSSAPLRFPSAARFIKALTGLYTTYRCQ